jgi:hypothetical protein
MPPDRPRLTEPEIIAAGGWPARYARVLAIAQDGDHAFALVDGNGDGAELEAETWQWDGNGWTGGASGGAGPLDTLGPSQTGGQIGDSFFAYGRAPGRRKITIAFDGQRHQVPVSRDGVWAFIKTSTSPEPPAFPAPVA